MSHRQDLLTAFDTLLGPERFKDYGPNGLQVEGRASVRKLVSGVTASRALIEEASGMDVSPEPLLDYLEEKFGQIYNL